jgi:hypothetical protein
MDMLYRICWRNPLSGCDGAGEFLLTQDEALVELARCEREYPELRHWAEREDGERLTSDSRQAGRM